MSASLIEISDDENEIIIEPKKQNNKKRVIVDTQEEEMMTEIENILKKSKKEIIRVLLKYDFVSESNYKSYASQILNRLMKKNN